METSVCNMFYLQFIEDKLERTLAEIVSMDATVQGLLDRYDSVRTKGHKSACYNLRLRISVAEGVRYMFVQYSKDLASEVVLLRRILFNEDVVISDDTDDDDSLHELSGESDVYDDGDHQLESSVSENAYTSIDETHA